LPKIQAQSALLLQYQAEPKNLKQRFAGFILGSMLWSHCFETLRTKEQLGMKNLFTVIMKHQNCLD